MTYGVLSLSGYVRFSVVAERCGLDVMSYIYLSYAIYYSDPWVLY